MAAVDMPVTQDRELLQVFVDHKRRIYIESYLASDERDPRWDAEVIKLANMAAHRTTLSYFTEIELPADVDVFDPKAVARQAREVAAFEAEGPLINGLLAWAFQDGGSRDEARHHAQQIDPDFLHEKNIHPLLRFWTVRRHAQMTALPSDDALWQSVDRAAAQSFEGPFVHPAERRSVYLVLWERRYKNLGFERRQRFIDYVQATPDADPWLAAAFTGAHAVETAWERRGGGYADTVTPAGWAGFEEYLTSARRSLIQATELQPDFPEPFTLLIKVAMAGEIQGDESPRFWFDGAMAAQADWFPAHRSLMWALRPRWGGSHDEMLALGFEVLAKGRFDTEAPWVFFFALQQIEEDRKDPHRRIWRDPAVQDGLDRYFDGAIESASLRGHETSIPFYRSREAAAAYLGQRYAKAQQILDELGRDLDRSVWHGLGVSHVSIPKSEMTSLLGHYGPLLEDIDRLIEADDLQAALVALDELEKTGNRDLPIGAIYRRRFKALALMNGGASSPIGLNTQRSRWGLLGFGGQWVNTAEGKISGTSNRRPGYGAQMAHTERLFHGDFDICGAVNLTPLRGRGKPNAAVVFGYYPSQTHAEQYWTVTFRRNPDRPQQSHVSIHKFFDQYSENTTAEVPEDFTFRVSLRENMMSVWVDGNRIIDEQQVPGYRNARHKAPFALGVGFRTSEKGQNVVFRDVMIYPGGLTTPLERKKRYWPPYRNRTVY